VPFRWSKPAAWFWLGEEARASTVVLSAELPSLIPAGYRPDLRFYARRGDNSAGLFDGEPVAAIEDYRAGPFEVTFAAPPGSGNLWIGWTVRGVSI